MAHRFGRTRWRRFAVILVPSVAVCATLGIAMSQGVLAASFLISGQRFKIATETFTVRGSSLYGTVDVTKKGERVPVLVTGARHARITGLCQSVPFDLPVLGPQTLRLTGGNDRPAEASNLFIDAPFESAGEADFRNLDVGIAQGAITKGPIDPGDRRSPVFDPSGFGQQATSVTLTNVHVNAVALSAGTFNIPGLRMKIEQGRHDCF